MLSLENVVSRRAIRENTCSVSAVQFYPLGDNDIQDVSHVTVEKRGIMQDGVPESGGVYDPGMGVTSMNDRDICTTCLNDTQTCPGHHGHIDLNYPVKNQLQLSVIVNWLRATCSACGSLVMVPEKQSSSLKELANIGKRTEHCYACGEPHIKICVDKPSPWLIRKSLGEGAPVVYFNHRIREHLERVSDETVRKVTGSYICHPKKLVWWKLLAPANTIRQEIEQSGGHGHGSNDITALLSMIVATNQKLPETIPAQDDLIAHNVRELYENMENLVFMMQVGSSSANGVGGGRSKIRSRKSSRPYKSLAQRGPKKTGRIRQDLLGVRTFKLARGVIAGNPHIPIDEVGIPLRIAKNLYIWETVRDDNLERMSMYVANGEEYPGASRIVRKQTGDMFQVKFLQDPVLDVGDVVYRHLVDGDIVDFGRQPSLTESSISTVKARIMRHGNAIRMNPSQCNFYNADFDGDAMLLVIYQDPLARAERLTVGNIKNWFISTDSMKPMAGLFYDSVISIARMTRAAAPRIHRTVAMQVCSKVPRRLCFTKEWYTGRELVEMVLPPVNLSGTPSMYKEAFSPPVQYNPEDTKVVIRGGKYVSGVLDKSTIGQKARGSLFHVIALEYGTKLAIDTIFNLQQMVEMFSVYEGFSIGFHDLYVSKQTRHDINEKLALQVDGVRRIVDRLDRGELFAPINQTPQEFLEGEILSELSTDGSLVKTVMQDTNVFDNALFQMILYGMKGSLANLESATAVVGQQQVRGGLPPQKFGAYRTLPWTRRFDMRPRANGFVAQSFLEGISADTFYFTAHEARSGLESQQSKTAASGTITRLCTRNMEVLAIKYNNLVGRLGGRVTQLMFGGNGFDLRKLQKCVVPGLKESDKEFRDLLSVDMSKLHKRYRHAQMKKLMDAHVEEMMTLRSRIRETAVDATRCNYSYIFEYKWFFPVKPQYVLEKVVQEFPDDKDPLDPVRALDQVENLVRRLPYIYFNRFYEKRQGDVQEYRRVALESLAYLVRYHLRVSVLLELGVSNTVLDKVCEEIFARVKFAILEAGTNVGVLVSLNVTAPITQFSLDAKHRVGVSQGSRTSKNVRVSEIVSATDTKNMKNPRMLLYVPEDRETDRAYVQELSNSIEMLYLHYFVDSTQLFFEEFGVPEHPRFVHEKKWVQDFLKKNDQHVPKGMLSKWCIRMELNSQHMVLKSITVLEIVRALQERVPGCFVVYSSSLDARPRLRVYFRSSALPKKALESAAIPVMRDYVPTFLDTVVRGVPGVEVSTVNEYLKTVVSEDGSVKTEKRWFIETLGTNLVETVLRFPQLDSSRCRSDSIREIEEIFGIESAALSINNEFGTIVPGILFENVSQFSDEMCITGTVTSLQLTGLSARNFSNSLLQMSLQDPTKGIRKAANRAIVNPMEGISAPLCMGVIPTSGTTCHEIVVDDDFIEANRHSATDRLQELEEAMVN